MDSKVVFEGDAPFHLPIPQQARAQGHLNNAVTVTFEALLPGRQQRYGLEVFEVQMIRAVARELGLQLLEAAQELARRDRIFPPSLRQPRTRTIGGR